ncbi:MAG: hypothetical protein P1V51_16785 [Deltaproteobacteria bacterium]|nr:hypothetical protein [Deltaproteobacteria bacterium]
MPLVILWCLLLVVSWPLALLCLVAWPLYWAFFAPDVSHVAPRHPRYLMPRT